MNIAVIGTGFVGVVTAAVYASFGHQVTGLDIDEKKVASLKKGKVPFYEPDLEKLLVEQQAADNLTFTTNYAEAVTPAEVVIIAVGTPSAKNGQADLTYVFSAVETAAPFLQDKAIVVVKSTVPPGTLDEVNKRLAATTKAPYYLASVPEFLREGTAVHDTLHPDRIVIGAEDQFAQEKLKALHEPLKAPVVLVKPSSAQMAKYAANAFLASRILFINEISNLAEKNEADVMEVIEAISYDKRIGGHYWYPGFGYGGSCFPKDVAELAAYSRSVGEENNLFNKMDELNRNRIPKLMEQYGEMIGDWKDRNVAVLGLSFKPNTNDMREAPAIKTIQYLADHGAHVKAYDPQAIPVAPHFIPKHDHVEYVEDIKEVIKDVEVIMALIEWPEITGHDFSSANNPTEEQWFIDARNQFDQAQVEKWGFNYVGVGR